MKVLVTGIGVVSAIGMNAEEHINNLKEEKSGISTGSILKTVGEAPLVGEVKKTNEQLKSMLNIHADLPVSRTALLGTLAAKEAFANCKKEDSVRQGFICGSTVGGMDLSENFLFDYHKTGSTDKYAQTVMHDLGTMSDFIADQTGEFEYVNSISTACSSAANSILIGARMIQEGLLDRVLVGGVDALSGFTMNGFKSLMIYDNEHCKPFSENRKGLNLGEGAGFLLLESDNLVKSNGSQVLGEFVAGANTNDAFHQTASSEEGKGGQLAMLSTLEKADIDPENIDYINAHGTGTNNNDASEMNAMKAVFGEVLPAYSSTKGFTGHTLGAAGGIEAVFSILALKEQMSWPSLNCQFPINENALVKKAEHQSIDLVMSNSFGFGGNCTCLIFKKK